VPGRNGDGPYLDLGRSVWLGLRASTPMSLTSEELDELRGLADPIQLTEVEDVYLPLSRLLRLYYQASGGLRETVGAFLGEPIRPRRSSSRSQAASPSASPRRPGCCGP
jgi:type I pantothenate kinase